LIEFPIRKTPVSFARLYLDGDVIRIPYGSLPDLSKSCHASSRFDRARAPTGENAFNATNLLPEPFGPSFVRGAAMGAWTIRIFGSIKNRI
jgi:hypothetical protein